MINDQRMATLQPREVGQYSNDSAWDIHWLSKVRDRLKRFATVSKALRVSKTQQRNSQINPNLFDLIEKQVFSTRFAVAKSKHFESRSIGGEDKKDKNS